MIEDAIINYVKGDTYSRDFSISNYDKEINKVLVTIKNNESDKRPLLQKSLIIGENNLFDKNNFPTINANFTAEYINGVYQPTGTIIENNQYSAIQYKITYIKCKPNTKYTLKINNTDGFIGVGTTTEIPTIGTTFNRPEKSGPGGYSTFEATYLTGSDAKYLVIRYYSTPAPDTYPPSEQEVIDSIDLRTTTISNGITLMDDENGVRTYNFVINANDTDNFKVNYEYFFAIKIFSYVDGDDIELTPIKGKLTLSARGD